MSSSHHFPSPRLKKVLVTPGLTPVLGTSSNPTTTLNAALLALQAQNDCSRLTASNRIHRKTIPKYVALHPSQNRVAYVVQTEATSLQKCVCVQDTVTQQVLWTAPWTNIAATVLNEQDSTKWMTAAKALGNVISLEFYDPATLFWSGMMEESKRKQVDMQRWQGLMVQTQSRVLVLNLRKGVQQTQVWPFENSKNNSQSMIMAHLSEESLGVAPSSNVLPLTVDWLLIGCNDGTLKCFDRKSQQTIKSIKGLGKGDWMVQLKAANPFGGSSQVVGPSRRRMITVTKKGVAYLIELEINHLSLEIRPPLARFSGGLPENVDPVLEHSLLTYDAHRDWIFWCQPKGSQPQQIQPVMNVWNLQALKNDLVQLDANAGPLKPEPTMKVLSGPGNGIVMIEPSGLTAAAFGDDHEHTLITITVAPNTSTLVLQGVNLRDPHQHRPQTMEGSPILSVRLAELLVREGCLDLEDWMYEHSGGENSGADNPLSALRIHAVKTHSLGPTSNQLVVATNIGLLVLEVALPIVTGPRYLHFGSNLGSFGKSAVSVRKSQIVYASLDTLTTNPVGAIHAKGSIDVYDCPMPTELPGEDGKRLFRASSYIIHASPSGQYAAILWPAEFRYEIVHVGTLLEKVVQVRGATSTASNSNPCVAKGSGIADLCWVGDNDVYAVLHVPGWEQMLARGNEGGDPQLLKSKTTMKAVATPKTKVAAKGAGSSIKSGSKGFTKKAFGLFGMKNRKGRDEDTAGDEESSVAVSVSSASITSPPPLPPAMTPPSAKQSSTRNVELFQLILNDTQSTTLGISTSPALQKSLGTLTLRGRHGNVPTALFGGPVLCVASRPEDDESQEGFAQFYGRKGDGDSAENYVSTGPTLPYPDLCSWDDDGCLCAISLGTRVAVYILDGSEFCMLGNLRITSPSQPLAPVTSLRFVHGVLYCCTWNSVHCIMLGNLTGEICHLDSFLLASTDAPAVTCKSEDDVVTDPLSPDPVLLPLVQPTVLGYQAGSLLLSTLRGVYAVSLEHPILRLGTLLASGQIERAVQWIDAFDEAAHEGLAYFLERRGYAALALRHLNGLSLETVIDLSMRYGDVDRIEDVVETHGVRGLRMVDMGRGVVASIFGPEAGADSITVAVGAYLLAYGRIESVRQLASECLRLDDQGKKDAFFLGALLMQANEPDANRLVQRAVDHPLEGHSKDDWLLGSLVRNFMLNRSS